MYHPPLIKSSQLKREYNFASIKVICLANSRGSISSRVMLSSFCGRILNKKKLANKGDMDAHNFSLSPFPFSFPSFSFLSFFLLRLLFVVLPLFLPPSSPSPLLTVEVGLILLKLFLKFLERYLNRRSPRGSQERKFLIQVVFPTISIQIKPT